METFCDVAAEGLRKDPAGPGRAGCPQPAARGHGGARGHAASREPKTLRTTALGGPSALPALDLRVGIAGCKKEA